MTQVTLAKKVRVTREYIAMLETGARQSPSLPMLKRIARALSVPVTELLE
jgi:transcriptional regulator with XRE-family HTH domain